MHDLNQLLKQIVQALSKCKWNKALRLWGELRLCMLQRGCDMSEIFGHHHWDNALRERFGIYYLMIRPAKLILRKRDIFP
jgi:hypothetical protein